MPGILAVTLTLFLAYKILAPGALTLTLTSPCTQDEASEAVRSLAKLALARYPTTLAEDEAVASEQVFDSPRLLFALMLRGSEKLVLEKMSQWGVAPTLRMDGQWR